MSGETWMADHIALLGQYGDAEAARRCSKMLVRISRKVRHGRTKVTTVYRKCRVYRSESAARKKRIALGIAPRHEFKRHWTREEIARLGKDPDGHIAKDCNCSRKCVFDKRKSLGRKPYRPYVRKNLVKA